MAMRVLVVDNYDSFVYNLVQYLGALGAVPVVVRNDAITVEDVQGIAPDAILISPGPGRPEDAGISLDLIRSAAGKIPILGVCLGHQAIAAAFGANVVRAQMLMHGKTSDVTHLSDGIFAGLPNPFVATRYHSLVVDPDSVPECLEVTATTADGTIMGLRHRDFAIDGFQFHPESILTECGKGLITNWLKASS